MLFCNCVHILNERSGVESDLNLSFSVTVYVANLSLTSVVLVTFRDLLTRNPIPNCLFHFLSGNIRLERLFLFSTTDSLFDSWIPQISTFFWAKTSSMPLSFCITPRIFRDQMNTLEKSIVRDLGIYNARTTFTLGFLRFHCFTLLWSSPHEHINSQLGRIFQKKFHYQRWTFAEPSLTRDGRHGIAITINWGPLGMSWPSVDYTGVSVRACSGPDSKTDQFHHNCEEILLWKFRNLLTKKFLINHDFLIFHDVKNVLVKDALFLV